MKKILQMKVSKIYVLVAILISVLCFTGYFSYAIFTVSKEKEEALSMVIGEINYTISGSGVSNNRVTVAGGGSQTITLTVTSQNEFETRYQLYYLNNSNVKVYYVNDNADPFGTIGINSSTKTIKIVIKNNSSSSLTITLGIQGGYLNNSLILESGRTAVNEIANFSVTTRSVTGGNVTVASNATVGTTVTFTTSPSSGFSYYGATIRNSSGGTLMTLDSNTRSFTMPSENVVVSPKWKYADKVVFAIDSSDDGAWSQRKQEGASAYASWQSSRHYIHFGGSGQSRVVAYSNKTYDLTHYQTYRAQAYHADATGKVSFTAGVSTTNTPFLRDVPDKILIAPPGNNTWVTINVDIPTFSGNYYLGFEVYSPSSYQAPFGYATLIGKVYE